MTAASTDSRPLADKIRIADELESHHRIGLGDLRPGRVRLQHRPVIAIECSANSANALVSQRACGQFINALAKRLVRSDLGPFLRWRSSPITYCALFHSRLAFTSEDFFSPCGTRKDCERLLLAFDALRVAKLVHPTVVRRAR